MALLIFFAAATVARIVRAWFFLLAHRARFIGAVACAARGGDLRLLLAADILFAAYRHRQHDAYRALADCGGHLIEHIEALQPESDHRVLLAVRAQSDAFFQLVKRIDMLHPARVNIVEQHLALELAHNFRRKFLFTLIIERMRALDQCILQRIAVDIALDVLGLYQPFVIFTQRFRVPVRLLVARRAVQIDRLRDRLINHLQDRGLQVFAV